jgi:hypothetical protein
LASYSDTSFEALYIPLDIFSLQSARFEPLILG